MRFALAGNPNSGKTTLFNSLTGSTAHVGNWPGVTVEKRSGTYKNKKTGERVDIVDLPGIYSLSPYTPEEVISRDFIIDEKPDCVINIIDATNLERNLYLTTQLLEMDVPLVIAINMWDLLQKNGDDIDLKKLSAAIGAPCVAISALKENGLDELMEVALKAASSSRKGTTVLKDTSLGSLINRVSDALQEQEVGNPLFHAVKLVENDQLETQNHKDLLPLVADFKATFNDETFGEDFEALIADARYKYISKNFSTALKHLKEKKKEEGKPHLTLSDKIDRVLTNKWAGIPIFIVILLVIFHLTFSEDFLFLNAANCFGPEGLVTFAGTPFEGLFANGGIQSPGMILANFVNSITGLISGAVASWMEGVEPWAYGLVVDGILAGMFAVIGFLPQILLLFLFFSIMEDSGYMARVAFILDRIFRRFGVTGRAFMPMIMGFGCSVPAMIATRTLVDDRERTATIRVIPFFACGAKMPVIAAVTGALAIQFGIGYADLITAGVYLLGMAVAIISLLVMRSTTLRGKTAPFIMELPAYHLPQFKSLMVHLWDKTKHFIKKAFTIILASTILIWFLQSFTWSWVYISEDSGFQTQDSILASIGMFVSPLFTPLGFGAQLVGSYGWVFAVGILVGLIAKENLMGAFAVIAATVTGIASDDLSDAEAIAELVQMTGATWPALISFIAFNVLTIPCFAACATAKGELPKGKFHNTVIFWLVVSYIASTIIYVVFSWWWTLFIVLAIALIFIVAVHYFNKWRDSRPAPKVS